MLRRNQVARLAKLWTCAAETEIEAEAGVGAEAVAEAVTEAVAVAEAEAGVGTEAVLHSPFLFVIEKSVLHSVLLPPPIFSRHDIEVIP